jgi:hypothetical protein
MCLNLRGLDRRLEIKGEHAGFEFNVVHNDRAVRCGYIRVLRGHPWFECSNPDVEVHGGVTYANYGRNCDTHAGSDEWWLGFDCGHLGDAADPSFPGTSRARSSRWQR